MLDPSAIFAEKIRKTYDGAPVLDGLDLDIPYGEIYGLLGPNGAGKTTALRIICGLLKPDAGHGRCLGNALGVLQNALGYMPQRGGLYDDLSIAENLRFFARAHSVDNVKVTVQAALDEHGLSARARQRVGTLSGGWRQRVALATTLLHRPRLLLLDEPSAGLDPLARDTLWRRLRQLATGGMTVLVTTHYADEAERCDRIGYLDLGRMRIEGPPTRLVDQLGLAVFHTARSGVEIPPDVDALATYDAGGSRITASSAILARVEFQSWCRTIGASAVPSRLADALNWLAVRDA